MHQNGQFFIEIPSDVIVDARGLPPSRAELLRYTHWRRREETVLARTREHRSSLITELDECKATLGKMEETISSDSAGIVDAIKRGAAKGLRSITGKGQSGIEPERAIVSHRISVGTKALEHFDREIGEQEAHVNEIASYEAAFVHAALLEHARTEFAPKYQKAIEELYGAVMALETIDSLVGKGHDGRMVIELPGFDVASHEADMIPLVFLPSSMRDAIALWRKLATAWASNPRADAAKILRFEPRNPDEQDSTPYENRTDCERHIIDIRRAKQRTFA